MEVGNVELQQRLASRLLYSGHLRIRHVEAVVEVILEANRKIDGITVYATIDSEVLERMKLAPDPHVLSVEKGRNFEMMAQLLGRGTELPRTTHADGAETSWTLHFYPDIVRPGYTRFPQSPSSRFLEVLSSGDRTKNPSGSGGFPFDKASASVGKQIVDCTAGEYMDVLLRRRKRLEADSLGPPRYDEPRHSRSSGQLSSR